MSKLGEKPIMLGEDVKVEVKEKRLNFSGKLGAISLPLLEYLEVLLKERELTFRPTAKHKQARDNWGTMVALAKNALVGVSHGFTKSLEIEGIGYRALMEGNTLILNVGFTHPVKVESPAGIKIAVQKNIISVTGINKELVGQVAAQIKKVKKPEPYKGKGIHYLGEVIRRKAGKKVAGTGTGGT